MVQLVCSDHNHPAYRHYAEWCQRNGHVLGGEYTGGDFLFLVSCTEIAKKEIRGRYKHVLVIHESALPHGRGWSPLAWQILEGKSVIPISIFEAEDSPDTGPLWGMTVVILDGTELYDEIHRKVALRKISLMEMAMSQEVIPIAQSGGGTFYPRRTKDDSRLDPEKPISQQFDLLRICDPRFPAFFDYRGARYEVTLRKHV